MDERKAYKHNNNNTTRVPGSGMLLLKFVVCQSSEWGEQQVESEEESNQVSVRGW